MKRKELVREGMFDRVYRVHNCRGMSKMGLLAFCGAPLGWRGKVEVDKDGNGLVTIYK